MRFLFPLYIFAVLLSVSRFVLAEGQSTPCLQLPDTIFMSGDLPEGQEDLTFESRDSKLVYNWLAFNIQLLASASRPVGTGYHRYKKMFTDKGWEERNLFIESMMSQFKNQPGQSIQVRSFLESAPRLSDWKERTNAEDSSKERVWYFSVPINSSSIFLGVATEYKHTIVVPVVYGLKNKSLRIDGWEVVTPESWKRCKTNQCRQLYRYN